MAIPGLHAQTRWLGAGVINLGVVLADAQGLTGFTLPLQLSPVAGGLIR